MTIPELEARAVELRAQGLSVHGPMMALHRKFALPFACFVLAVIGLGLGVQHGRGGKLAAFVPGISVVFVYYVIEYGGRQMAKGQLMPGWLAVWLPNIVLGIGRRRAAVVARAVGRQADPALTLPARWKGLGRRGAADQRGAADAEVAHGGRDPAARLAAAGRAAARHLREQARAEGRRAHLRRPARHLLHLDVHRSVRQALQGPDDGRDAGRVLLLQDARVRLLHHPAHGAHRRDGDHRHPDEEQRAGRDAGLRHQPVPRGGADGAAGHGGQRVDVPAAGSRAALLESPRAGACAT